MNSRITYITLAVAALILARVLMNLAVDPLAPVREDVARSLAEVPANTPLADGDAVDFARVQQEIAAVPSLWQALIEAPIQSAPPPAQAAPDLAEMLSGIVVGREQIGTTKIKVFTPESPGGTWIQVGDSIYGCTLASFTREEAVFAYVWAEGGSTLKITLPRE